jgi:Tfp pilus assembly PilM family ATPase
MRRIPLLSDFFDTLTAPNLPRTSLSISETHLSLITLRRKGREFEPRNLGVLRLPGGVVRASFTEPNIANEPVLIEHLSRTAAQAGMKNVRMLSVSLPPGSARCMVAALDSVPGSRAELAQLIEWKAERGTGQKAGDLRISYSRLSDLSGRPQYLISAVAEQVVSQYEQIFKRLGWQAGMITPPTIGEAQWLIRQGLDDDQVVVSVNERGFDAVIVRGKEPLLVREVECAPEERENEFFRLMVFYRDRLAREGPEAPLSRLLTIGAGSEQRRFRDVLSSAMDRNVVALDPPQIGLRVDPNAPFNYFAAAGGLATMAWD